VCVLCVIFRYSVISFISMYSLIHNGRLCWVIVYGGWICIYFCNNWINYISAKVLTLVTQWVPLVKQELLILLEYRISRTFFGVERAATFNVRELPWWRLVKLHNRVILVLISKLNIFPLISLSGNVCINFVTLILKNIGQSDVTLWRLIPMKKITSLYIYWYVF